MSKPEAPFSKPSIHHQADFNHQNYLERTKRNHFWFGGPSGQEEIRKLKIAVAGLGGMGSQIAELLVRLGVGHIRISDPDHIETSNLNRQVIANGETVGLSKARASAEELRKISNDFELVVYDQGVTDENVEEFVDGCDAIVDEIDVFPLDRHVALHRAAIARKLALYSSYVVGLGIHMYKFEGHEFTFEDFLSCPETLWKKPTSDLILDRFGQPFATYLQGESVRGYAHEIASSGVPIFGPATLLGQSLVVTRMILDLLKRRSPHLLSSIKQSEETPRMPNFLVLDPIDFTFKTVRFQRQEN